MQGFTEAGERIKKLTEEAIDRIDSLTSDYRGHGIRITGQLASKAFFCVECECPIEKGKRYLKVEYGTGLLSRKFPDRVHLVCRLKFLERRGIL